MYRLLHVRGGVSDKVSGCITLTKSSPRPWRCFLLGRCSKLLERVFSTSVEVFLVISVQAPLHLRLLHVRGGVSGDTDKGQIITKSSPRPWRCFQGGSHERWRKRVFSTSVEVFLDTMNLNGRKDGLLHVRGGVSLDKMWLRVVPPSSPRPWRCFFPQAVHANDHRVFSTSVEVFLTSKCRSFRATCLLHVRGGVFA